MSALRVIVEDKAKRQNKFELPTIHRPYIDTSRYTGEKLREIRRLRGVGRPPSIYLAAQALKKQQKPPIIVVQDVPKAKPFVPQVAKPEYVAGGFRRRVKEFAKERFNYLI